MANTTAVAEEVIDAVTEPEPIDEVLDLIDETINELENVVATESTVAQSEATQASSVSVW